jgi:heat shock protein HtpX
MSALIVFIRALFHNRPIRVLSIVFAAGINAWAYFRSDTELRAVLGLAFACL